MSSSDPERKALALHYDAEAAITDEHAPRVVAQGAGWVAERILALARQHGIPVSEDRDLVALLSTCDVDDEIPPELFSVVAEVLAWLHACDCERSTRHG